MNRNGKRNSRISILLVGLMLLQLLVQPLASPINAASQITGLNVENTASTAVVNIGESFSYYIDYSVFGETQVGNEIIVVDTIPSQFEIISGDWTTRNGQTLTFGPEMLQSGTAGRFTIEVKVKPTGVSSAVQTTNTATVTVIDTNEMTTASANVTINPDPGPSLPPGPGVTESTYDVWEVRKSQNTGFGDTVPIVGGEVTYKVEIRNVVDGNYELAKLSGLELVDELPPGAVYVKSTEGGVHNAGIVKWTISELLSGESFAAEVTVRYPDNYGYGFPTNTPLERVNVVKLVTYTPEGGGTVKGSGQATVKTLFGEPRSGNLGITKTKQYDYRWYNQEQTFFIGGISNTGPNVNFPVKDVVLTEQLPLELDYTSIKMPGYKWNVFRYEVSDGVDRVWKVYGGSKGASSTLTIGETNTDILLLPGEYLTSLEWTYNTLPTGKEIKGIELKGIVREIAHEAVTPLQHGHEVVNRVTLDYKSPSPTFENAWVTEPQKVTTRSFLINNEKPWLQASKKVESGNYRPLSKVKFELEIENVVKATGPYIQPFIYDLLPAGFDYYTNPKIVDPAAAIADSYSWSTSTGIAKPKLEIIKDFNHTGRTMLKWYWDEPINPADAIKFEPGTKFKITYQGLVGPGALRTEGSIKYINDLYVTTSNPNMQFWHKGDGTQDAIDSLVNWQLKNQPIEDSQLNFDPTPGVKEFFVHESAEVKVNKSSQVQSTKWNRGDLSPIFKQTVGDEYLGQPATPVQPFESDGVIAYTEYPYYSVTYEGGSADYKLVIRNSGNTRLGEIDLLDILPHVNDYAVKVRSNVPAEARGSQWQPNLAEVMNSGPTSFTSTAATGSRMVDFNVDAYYSKSVDQDGVVNFENATGSQTGWIPQSSFTSDDLTDIKSLYFKITNITGSDRKNGLAPGDYIVLDWKMDAPVGAPTNSVAWNSFAIQATELGATGNGEESKMPPTAPNKVGFIVHPNDEHVPLGEIGNFVWFDSNRDGIQNEGYAGDENQAAGINGIKVNLYKEGETVPFKSSKTGYHFNGSPGYYLFQGLEAGNYFVEFVLPEHYTTTLQEAPGGSQLDSNFVTKGATDSEGYTQYRTNTITLGNAGKDLTIDLGLIEADSPTGQQYPSITMDKKITGVEKGASGVVSTANYVVVGDKIHYAIEVENTSSVTLHNMKIGDQMDRSQSGFAFTKLIYDQETIAIHGSSHNRPDIITSLVNSGNAPYLKIKRLEPGKRITLEGVYSVVSADLDLTKLENEVTVNYNESPEPITDREEIHTAGLRVEKVSNVLSVSTVGASIDYTVTITNTGSRDLTNVVITDTKVTGIPAIPLLKAGESHEITYTYTVKQADLSQIRLANQVTADPDETPPVTTVHEVPVVTTVSGTIGNYVWLDANEDGVQDSQESGINGIVVKLYDSVTNQVISQTVTKNKEGKSGYYTFEGLPQGTYNVQFIVPEDYSVTKSEAATPDQDSNKTDANGMTDAIVIGPQSWNNDTIDLGLMPRGKIGNYVWLDLDRDGIQNETDTYGINGITVKLFKGSTAGTPIATTVTANDSHGKAGYYLFDNLLAGEYYVQFILPDDYKVTSAQQGMDRTQDSNALDAEGKTTKIVIGEKSGWVDHSIDLGLVAKGVIGNYVWHDSNGNGKQDEPAANGANGIVVKLFDKDHQLLQETVTASNNAGKSGYYQFDQLISGEYVVYFNIPKEYNPTKSGVAGVSPELDSNTLVDGLTEVITIGDSAPYGWVNLTVDVGMVPKPILPEPSNPGSSGNSGNPGTVDPGKPTEPKKPEQPDPDPSTEPTTEAQLSDISGHWAEDVIKQAVSAGIVKGYPDGTFKPNATVTRAEFVVMLMNALKLTGNGVQLSFTDPIPAWAKQSIAHALEAEIIRGYDDGTFRPTASITRSELAVMIARAAGEDEAGFGAASTGFADDTTIPSWAKEAVAAMKELGIVSGRSGNLFAPHETATRAEAVTIIMNLLRTKE